MLSSTKSRTLGYRFLSTVLSKPDTTSPWDYDILICGGGIVGAALASKLLHLTKGNVKVAILEQNQPETLHDCIKNKLPDKRVYAISPKTIQFLKSVNAFNSFENRSQSYANMQVWELGSPGMIRFSAQEMQTEELGRIAEDCVIQASLYESMKIYPNSVDFLFNSTISSFDINPCIDGTFFTGPAAVTYQSQSSKDSALASKKTLTCRLVVGADGGNSAIRRMSGIASWGWNYGQTAIVCTVKTNESAVNNTAYQVYLPTGPLAMLPLWNGMSSIVWSLPTPDANKLLSVSTAEFATALNEAFQQPYSGQFNVSSKVHSTFQHQSKDFDDSKPLLSLFFAGIEKLKSTYQAAASDVLNSAVNSANVLSDVSAFQQEFAQPPMIECIISDRVKFPLALQQASSYVSPRIALIGDAAHSIHPQAGQGLNLGVLDADCLAQVITEALSNGSDIGAISILKKYGDSSYFRNLRAILTIDMINSTFSTGQSANNHLRVEMLKSFVPSATDFRAVGMLGLNSFRIFKNAVAKYAMGN